jgi:hypothetical protein
VLGTFSQFVQSSIEYVVWPAIYRL